MNNNFLETLTFFDKVPFAPLIERDVFNILHSNLPEDKSNLTLEQKAELCAFQFSEFFPETENISTHVSKEMLPYWENRISEAKHPVIIARYAGIIYDLTQRLTDTKPSYLIAKKYIEALLDTIEFKLYKVAIYAVRKVTVALKIAIALNDDILINKTKAIILTLESLIAEDDKPGLWGFSFDLLVLKKNKLLTVAEENKIIQDLEKRLSVVMMSDARAAELLVQRLSLYYHKKQKPNEVDRTFNCLKTSFEYSMKNLPAIQKADYVERLIKLYKKLNLHKEVQASLVWLREISKGTDSEMKSVSTTIDIPKDKIHDIVDKILEGDTETIFTRIISVNTPKIQEAKKEINAMAQTTPISFLMSKGLMDKEGRKVATIGSLKDDPEANIVLQISQSISIGAFALHFIFDEAIKREIFTPYEIMKFLRKSCVIEKDRFYIFEKGIEAYFDKNYLISIHLLIPQFEQAIRKLIEINGGNVLVIKEDGYNLITFDKILNDPIVLKAIGEDTATYYKVLFTDKRGWNLRNTVAHGIHEASKFDKQTNERLLHAILSLGLIRMKEVLI